MEREIIFRGKDVDNGEWVEGTVEFHLVDGGLTKTKKEAFITFDKMDSTGKVYRFTFEVDPETVGQYTGLKDSTGKRIFEGDIVKVRDPYNGCWSVNGGEVIFSTEYVGGWVLTSNGKDGLNIGTRTNNIKIIGNVHENPELLQVQ